MPEMCVERARLITRFSLESGLFQKSRISILDKAKVYRKVLENRAPIVWHRGATKKGWFPLNSKIPTSLQGRPPPNSKAFPLS